MARGARHASSALRRVPAYRRSGRGRAPGDIELGGLLLLGAARDGRDSGLRELATRLGFPDYASAQRAPVALLGTPAEIREELATRVAATGVTDYMVLPANAESERLFAEELMPAFAN